MSATAQTANRAVEKQPTPRYAWVILAVVFLASFTVPINFFKVPTLGPVMMESFGFTPDTFGWLMSVFTIVSIILAFPAAGIAKKAGIKKVALVAIGSCIVGGLIGVFSTTQAMLLISRVFEGVGMGFFGVLAPTALARWFPAHRFGLAAGIWGIWMPFGSVVMMNLVPAIYGATNTWQTVWWFAIGFSIVAFIVFFFFYKEPDGFDDKELDQEGEAKPLKKTSMLKAFTLSLVMLGIMFTVYNVCINGTVNTFFPTFLQMEHGMDMAAAGFITSVITFLNIICSMVSGAISDKLGTRKWLIVAALVILSIACWFLFSFTNEGFMWLAVVLCGLFPPFVSTCATAAVPEIVPKEHQGTGMAMLGFSSSIGSFIGGVALGWLVPSMGWSMGSHVLLLPLLAIAIVCTLFIKVR